MKIAVTGYNGFIGKYLLQELKNYDYEIIKLERSSGNDIMKSGEYSSIPKFDVLIHLAANTYVPDSFKNPLQFYSNNILGTLKVLELCKKFRARLIFISSYVYGHPKYLPIDELHEVSSLNPYSESKIICERLVQAYYRDFNVATTILRPFNIYGKGQNESFLIPLIVKQVKEGKVMLRDKRPKRDFVHVKDVVNAIIKVLEKGNESVSNEGVSIYNVGYGESVSIQTILEIIKSINGVPEFNVEFNGERRPNEVLDTASDISKIARELNWKPTINLKEGLSDLFR